MQHMRTADAVIESLIRHGIDTLYALPGVHNDHLFDAAHRAQDRFRVLHPRHEQTAAYMALGAALVTGKPQAFAVVPGPGLLNASAALLTAYGMGAPVIALVGQIPSFAIDQGHGHLHEIHDQLGLLRHITKHAARIRAPHEAPALVAEAMRIACSGRQRPVALECAIDTWGATGAVEFPDIAAPTVPPVDADAVTRAAKILGQAERPLIVVGGGALDAGPEVQAIAEALAGAGVVVPSRPRCHSDDASARRVVHRGPRTVAACRRGAGDRHAAVLAAERLGRGRHAADRAARHRSRGDRSLPPSRLRAGRRCRDSAARAARRTAGAQPAHASATRSWPRCAPRSPNGWRDRNRRWVSCAPSVPRCRRTASMWRR